MATEFFMKANDMYDFVQSNDLKSFTPGQSPLVAKFREVQSHVISCYSVRRLNTRRHSTRTNSGDFSPR